MAKLEIIKNVVVLCSRMIELLNNNHVIVEHKEVNALVNLGAFFGIIVHGGAFIGENHQCLYIE